MPTTSAYACAVHYAPAGRRGAPAHPPLQKVTIKAGKKTHLHTCGAFRPQQESVTLTLLPSPHLHPSVTVKVTNLPHLHTRCPFRTQQESVAEPEQLRQQQRRGALRVQLGGCRLQDRIQQSVSSKASGSTAHMFHHNNANILECLPVRTTLQRGGAHLLQRGQHGRHRPGDG